MAPLDSSLFREVLVRLAPATAVSAWLGVASWRWARRSLGDVAWDVAVVAAAVWWMAGMLAPALLLGSLGALGFLPWCAGAALAGLGQLLLARRAAPPREALDAGQPPSRVFLVALGGYALGRAAFGLRNPPADWDSIQYHLPMLGHWAASGALGVPVREPAALGMAYPGNAELLDLWAAFSTGRDTLVTWPGILALAVAALAVRRLALRCGARPVAAEGVALLLAAAPGLMQLTLGLRVDLLLAAWFAVALLGAERFRAAGRPADLAVLLIALGGFAGARANGFLLAALVGLLALAGRGFARRERSVAALPVEIALAALLGGFWIARDTLVTGNPLFPAAFHLGSHAFAGLESLAFLARTSQLATWREGYAGHLTPGNLLFLLGPFLPVLALGLVLAVRRPGRSREATADRASGAGWLVVVALATFAVFLVAPFSGSFWPAEHGHPPGLNRDNLRQLVPACVALAPLAAFGLSVIPDGPLAAALGALFLLGVRHGLGHVIPGLAVAALAALAWPRARALLGGPWRRGALAALGVVAVALAVTAVEPLREKVSGIIWDGYLARDPNLPARAVRDLRARAGGRPIALVGVEAWWAYFGRDLSGRPCYVPVALAERTARSNWTFGHDDRRHASRERWLANLGASGATCLVVGPISGAGGEVPPVEARWAAADTARFQPLGRWGACAAWSVRAVRGVPAAPIGARSR